MLKYIGDLDLLVSKYGFEYSGGCYQFVEKKENPFGIGGCEYTLSIDKFRKHITILKPNMPMFNVFDEILEKLYILIKDGLVIKEVKSNGN